MTVRADELAEAVSGCLEEYGQEVRQSVRELVVRVSRECLASIRAKAPKRTGAYWKGWTRSMSKSGDQPEVMLYNKKYYRLTHLLEYGHAKADGGRVPGRPHIAPAADRAAKDLERGIRQALEE